MPYIRGFFAVVLAAAIIAAGSPVSRADNRLGNRGHWERTPPVARVKFLDYTGTPWPVNAVNSKWDEADNIDTDWEVASSYSNCGAECVRVRAVPNAEVAGFGPNCTDGLGYWTNYDPDDSYHYGQGNEVVFNRSCNSESRSVKMALVCQELGHALGLEHSNSTGSCMWQNPFYADSTPGPHQYDMLDSVIYNH